MKGENHIIIEKNQDLLVFLVGFVVAFLGGGGGGRRCPTLRTTAGDRVTDAVAPRFGRWIRTEGAVSLI